MDHSKTEHPNTEHEYVQFSNGFRIRMVGIRAEQWNRLHKAQFDPDKVQAEMQKLFFIKLLIWNITSQNDKYWSDSEW